MRESKKPLWSVIIPIYNKSSYVTSCINSLINQTCGDFEIICVDDASEDNSADIIRSMAKNEKRLKLIENECNEGAGKARNKGLEYAKGKYVQFVDADDFLSPNHLELCTDILDKHNASVGFISFSIENEGEDKRRASEGVKKTYGVMSGKDLLGEFVLNGEFFLYACGIVCRRDFLVENNLFFDSLKIGEGGLFVLKCLCCAPRAMVINNKGSYHYVLNDSSASAADKSRLYTLMGQLEQFIYIQKLFSQNPKEKSYLLFLKWYQKHIEGGIQNLTIKEMNEFKTTEYWDEYHDYWFDKLKECSDQDIDYCEIIKRDDIETIKRKGIAAIYGAGNDSFLAIKMLHQLDVRMVGLFVTETNGNRKTLYGHCVLSSECMNELDHETPIIVTTKKRHYPVIKKKLKDKGFVNVCFYR